MLFCFTPLLETHSVGFVLPDPVVIHYKKWGHILMYFPQRPHSTRMGDKVRDTSAKTEVQQQHLHLA